MHTMIVWEKKEKCKSVCGGARKKEEKMFESPVGPAMLGPDSKILFVVSILLSLIASPLALRCVRRGRKVCEGSSELFFWRAPVCAMIGMRMRGSRGRFEQKGGWKNFLSFSVLRGEGEEKNRCCWYGSFFYFFFPFPSGFFSSLPFVLSFPPTPLYPHPSLDVLSPSSISAVWWYFFSFLSF